MHCASICGVLLALILLLSNQVLCFQVNVHEVGNLQNVLLDFSKTVGQYSKQYAQYDGIGYTLSILVLYFFLSFGFTVLIDSMYCTVSTRWLYAPFILPLQLVVWLYTPSILCSAIENPAGTLTAAACTALHYS